MQHLTFEGRKSRGQNLRSLCEWKTFEQMNR